ncbi:MAG TPA: glycosyltransferase, partial [Bacteroidetes bacterium]|nr:glycosyltransferase [Bacteroidota bacterium]
MDVLISIIIVNFNVRDFLAQTLRSVKKATRSISSQIIVVDNHSSDGSSEIVEKNFPGVVLLKNTENIGFARANNQALKIARGKYLVLLNPDTIVQEDTFETLIRFFDTHPEAGMAGCRILNPDGTLQLACRRSFPTPWVAFTKLVGLDGFFPKSRLFGRYNLTYLDPNRPAEVDAISGSFMMVRREVYEQVGALDERFFMYGEDLDWCFRIKKAGWQIYYVPKTQIIHYKGASSIKSERDTLLLFYKAMLQFVQKHFKGKYLFLPQWFLITGIAVRGGISFLIRLLKKLALPFVDLLFLNLALIIGLIVRFGSPAHLSDYFIVDAIYSAVWLASFYFFDLYERQKFSLSRAMSAILLGLVVNGTFTFFFKQIAFSRVVVLVMGLAALILLPGWRLAVHLLAKSRKLPFLKSFQDAFVRKKTVLVGPGAALQNLITRLRQRPDTGSAVVGLVLPSEQNGGEYAVPLLGTLENLPWIIQNEKIREVIFSSGSLNYDLILQLISPAEGS